jgi:hypothetical protein
MATYRAFNEQVAAYLDRPHLHLPKIPVASLANWRGAELRHREADWTITLDETAIGELQAAGRAMLDRRISLADMTRPQFPLPTLGATITALGAVVSKGRGFVLLRGLPVDAWGEELSMAIYWGLGFHFGLPGAQNPAGELLGHVIDYGEKAAKPLVRSYRTAGNIDFHCDPADAVGLLCLRTARHGGQSRIASSVAIFNEILRVRPDLAPRLFSPFKLDRRDEQAEGEDGWLEVTPCRYSDGVLRTFYHSEYFRSVQRHGRPAELDETAAAVLDLYDSVAADPEFYLDMDLRPGDLQLISNHVVVHARTPYEDYPQRSQRRHLLRLWLSLTAA